MMRSLFSGVSGLRAHQQKLDVIGNNVANVNTVGFKSGRVTFSDIFNQTLSGATAPDSSTGRGGRNPVQVGLGVGISAIDTITTRGSTETTGNATDLAINGNGFFIVRSGSSGTYQFTRAGNFTLDKSGNLVTSDGLNVYGWQDYGGVQQSDGSYKYDTDKAVEPVNLYSDDYNKNKQVLAAKATENVAFKGSLNSSEDALGTDISTIDITSLDPQYSTTMTAYDSLGNSYELQVNFYKCGTGTNSDGNTATSWYWDIPAVTGLTAATDTGGFIEFDSSGNIVASDTANFGGDTDLTTAELTFTPANSVGSNAITLKLDFSSMSMSSGDSSAEASSVDGYAAGTLEDFSIGSDGIIMGVYSNGKQQPLGMVALASFDNPAGLAKSGSNTYVATANSGDFKNGVKVGSDGTGLLSAGSLEMSNVDLSNEFSEMIITQRGFQANSRIITTADQMLEELVNLKR